MSSLVQQSKASVCSMQPSSCCIMTNIRTTSNASKPSSLKSYSKCIHGKNKNRNTVFAMVPGRADNNANRGDLERLMDVLDDSIDPQTSQHGLLKEAGQHRPNIRDSEGWEISPASEDTPKSTLIKMRPQAKQVKKQESMTESESSQSPLPYQAEAAQNVLMPAQGPSPGQLSDRQLTSQLSSCTSCSQLLQLITRHRSSLNSIHLSTAAAALVRMKAEADKKLEDPLRHGRQRQRKQEQLRGQSPSLGSPLLGTDSSPWSPLDPQREATNNVKVAEDADSATAYSLLASLVLEPGVLGACLPRELGSLAWAMAKLFPEDKRMPRAFAFASVSLFEAHQNATLRRGRHVEATKHAPQTLANLLWALAEWQYMDKRALDSLTASLSMQVSSMSPQDCSIAVWAFAKLEYLPSPQLLRDLLRHSTLHLSSFKPQGLSNLIWGLSRLVGNAMQQQQQQQRFPHKCEQSGTAPPPHVSGGTRHSWTPAIVKTFVRSSCQMSTAVCELILSLQSKGYIGVDQHGESMRTTRREATPENGRRWVNVEASEEHQRPLMIINRNGFSSGGEGPLPSYSDSNSRNLTPLSSNVQRSYCFKPQEISSLLVGVATLSKESDRPLLACKQLATVVAASVSQKDFETWPPQAVVNTVWASVTLGSHCGELIDTLSRAVVSGAFEVQDSPRGMPKREERLLPMPRSMVFSPAELAMLLWAISSAVDGNLAAPPSGLCTGRLARAAAAGLFCMEPQGVSMAAWACGRQRTDASLSVMSKRASEWDYVRHGVGEVEGNDSWALPLNQQLLDRMPLSSSEAAEAFIVPGEAARQLLLAAYTEIKIRGVVGFGPGPIAAVLNASWRRGIGLSSPKGNTQTCTSGGKQFKLLLPSTGSLPATTAATEASSQLLHDLLAEEGWSIELGTSINGTSINGDSSGDPIKESKEGKEGAKNLPTFELGIKQHQIELSPSVSPPTKISTSRVPPFDAIKSRQLLTQLLQGGHDTADAVAAKLIQDVLSKVAESGMELVAISTPPELAALVTACARMGLRSTGLYGPAAQRASSSVFIRNSSATILSEIAWAIGTAGYRCDFLFSKIIWFCSDPQRNGGISSMAPSSLQKLMWTASATRHYDRSLFDTAVAKLKRHIPLPMERECSIEGERRGEAGVVEGTVLSLRVVDESKPSESKPSESKPSAAVDVRVPPVGAVAILWSLATVRHYDEDLIERLCAVLCQQGQGVLQKRQRLRLLGEPGQRDQGREGQGRGTVGSQTQQQQLSWDSISEVLTASCPAELLSPGDLSRLMWSVAFLGAGVFQQWRPPLLAMLAAAPRFDVNQVIVMLWALAVQQQVLLSVSGSKTHSRGKQNPLGHRSGNNRQHTVGQRPGSSKLSIRLINRATPNMCLLDSHRLSTHPRNSSSVLHPDEGILVHRKGSYDETRGDDDDEREDEMEPALLLLKSLLGRLTRLSKSTLMSLPPSAAFTAAEALSLLLAGPRAEMVHTKVFGIKSREWRRGGQERVKEEGGQEELTELQQLLVNVWNNKTECVNNGFEDGLPAAGGQGHMERARQGLIKVLRSLGYNPELPPPTHELLPLLGGSQGGGRAAVILPGARLALLLADKEDFAANVDSSSNTEEPLGLLFTSLLLMRNSLSLHTSVVDYRAWCQLKGLRERQLYVLQLLGQADHSAGQSARSRHSQGRGVAFGKGVTFGRRWIRRNRLQAQEV